jgi:hypothetical protein
VSGSSAAALHFAHGCGATRGEVVRAEPFEAIELRVGAMFGEEE